MGQGTGASALERHTHTPRNLLLQHTCCLQFRFAVHMPLCLVHCAIGVNGKQNTAPGNRGSCVTGYKLTDANDQWPKASVLRYRDTLMWKHVCLRVCVCVGVGVGVYVCVLRGYRNTLIWKCAALWSFSLALSLCLSVSLSSLSVSMK